MLRKKRNYSGATSKISQKSELCPAGGTARGSSGCSPASPSSAKAGRHLVVSGSTAEPPRPPQKCHFLFRHCWTLPSHPVTSGSRAELIHGVLSIPKSVRTCPSPAQVQRPLGHLPCGDSSCQLCQQPWQGPHCKKITPHFVPHHHPRPCAPHLGRSREKFQLFRRSRERRWCQAVCAAGIAQPGQCGNRTTGAVTCRAGAPLLSPPRTSTLQIKAWQQAGSSGKTSTK